MTVVIIIAAFLLLLALYAACHVGGEADEGNGLE
jgi:hypothetical protein